jgi:hypothetical protein
VCELSLWELISVDTDDMCHSDTVVVDMETVV